MAVDINFLTRKLDLRAPTTSHGDYRLQEGSVFFFWLPTKINCNL